MERKKSQNSQRFIAVRKDNQGRIIEFKSDNGKIYNYEMAKEAIDLNLVTNAECFISKDGTRLIKAKENQKTSSLNDFPEF